MATAKEVTMKELDIFIHTGEKAPSFIFKGGWNGHDLSAVIRNIRREYARYTRDLRRKEASETGTTPAKEETK